MFSEWEVVGIVGGGYRGGSLWGRGFGGTFGHVLFAGEHLHVVAVDFGGVSFDPVLVFPVAGAQASLDVEEHAFFDVFLGDLGKAPPENDVVPLGLTDLFAVFVIVDFRGGEAETGDGHPAVKVAYFGVGPDITDENYFVYHGVIEICRKLRNIP